jgi:hypothetical protein
VSVQAVEEDVMVDSVERGRQVEEDYCGSDSIVGGP